jgi:hypothetical protein
MSELITEVPESFVREFREHIEGTIPDEKVQVELRQARNARVMQSIGSAQIEGLGQKVAEIDARLYFRMMHSFGHHEGWLQDLLADNPQLVAPGYKPRKRKNDLRHSMSFVNGAPVR